jgi:hypothetical protein
MTAVGIALARFSIILPFLIFMAWRLDGSARVRKKNSRGYIDPNQQSLEPVENPWLHTRPTTLDVRTASQSINF